MATERSAPRRTTAVVLLFYLALFELLSPGRLNSSDSLSQLQAATLLAERGRLGSSKAPGTDTLMFAQGTDGAYYAALDLGNVLLMLPSAWAGGALAPGETEAQVDAPPLVARFLAALTSAAFAATGCTWLFMLLARYQETRTAFLLSLMFAVATPFIAYARCTLDILGGCVGVCLLLERSAAALSRPRPGVWSGAMLGAGFAMASTFRYSLAPFLGLGLLATLFLVRGQMTRGGLVACVAVAGLLLAPSLFYNMVRTGSPLRPATTLPKYSLQNGLSGDLLDGLFGLTLNPVNGIVWFAPIVVVVFRLPFIWSALPVSLRRLLLAYGPPSVAYVFMIALKTQWYTFGWGPRYLLPVLPMLYLGAAASLFVPWGRAKGLPTALVALSLGINFPLLFIDWPATMAEASKGIQLPASARPIQQVAAWQALARGLTEMRPFRAPGVPGGPDVPSGRFPDLWSVQLLALGRAHAMGGLSAIVVLSALAGWSFRRMMFTEDEVPSGQ